jgi:hypothetical protein
MTKQRRPRHKPLSFRAWEAANKLKEGLAYRTPKGRPMKHVVLRRDLAVALLSTVQRHYASNGASIVRVVCESRRTKRV